MSTAAQRIKAFFERWERITDASDPELIASQYTDPFLFADPSGTRVVERQKFVAALPRRREFFKNLGHKHTRIERFHETALDDHYVLVRVGFLMVFETAAAQRVEQRVESTFILHLAGEPKILMHIEHESLEQALRTSGVLR